VVFTFKTSRRSLAPKKKSTEKGKQLYWCKTPQK